MSNLELADKKARRGKKKQHVIRTFDRNKEGNLLVLEDKLRTKTYRTSAYTTFNIFEPKERVISRLPYYPDRIVHHAIMNVLEPIFVSFFTADTYSCIKGRGIHGAANAVKSSLHNDVGGTTYCLQLDIRKFYPSIDRSILKALLRRKFKDANLLWLLDEIIDSAEGLPIGNYLSQYLANFYLTGFDHWLKETKRVKYYFRYADDMVFLSDSKEFLHSLRKDIQAYLQLKLGLALKANYRVFPVSSGVDFVGYKFYHTHTLLRKGIKKNFAKMMVRNRNEKSIASYYGWTKHCNGINLTKTLHEKIQRPRNKSRRKQSIHRRQNKNRQNP